MRIILDSGDIIDKRERRKVDEIQYSENKLKRTAKRIRSNAKSGLSYFDHSIAVSEKKIDSDIVKSVTYTQNLKANERKAKERKAKRAKK
jgi:hypothetical protein